MTVLRLEAKDIRALKDGINFKKNKENGKCYIIYKGKDKIRACVNQCKHQGGLFIKDIEDMDGRWVNPNQHNNQSELNIFFLAHFIFKRKDA